MSRGGRSGGETHGHAADGTAISVNPGWGALTLALLSAEQAIVEQQAIPPRILRNLGLALIIVANSVLAGSLVGWRAE